MIIDTHAHYDDEQFDIDRDELLNSMYGGGIGLDYYWDNESRDIQKKWFIRQLETARKKEMPVIIHSREAAADTMEIMRGYASGIRAVIHWYSYSAEMTKEKVITTIQMKVNFFNFQRIKLSNIVTKRIM